MKTKMFAALVATMLPFAAQAATVAIIDSGFDPDHEALRGKVWVNPNEVAGDNVDNDGNGKIDDINGWNFADNNAQIIDYSQQENYTPDIEKFLDLQLAASAGQATEGEKIWLKDQLADRDFLKKFQAFGSYAHGTHVAGIVARDNPGAKLLAIKMTSTKSRVRKLKSKILMSLAEGKDVNFIKEFVLKAGLYGLAYHQAKSFAQVGSYLAQAGVSVANGWAPIDMAQARGLVTPLLMVAAEAQPSAVLVDEYAEFFVRRVMAEEQKVIARYPDILFVFAAGNDGTDNDELLSAPAAVRMDNVLTVGASVGNVALAPFSNYGASRVDLFAPGVGIRSSVPRDNLYLPFSGTTIAAPAVARVASMIKDKNPALKAKDIRDILMGTSDRKDFLKARSYTEGVINDERALIAAEQSLTTDVHKAIQLAKRAIADKAPKENLVEKYADYSFVTPL